MDKKKQENETTRSFQAWKRWQATREFSAPTRSRRGLQREVYFVVDSSAAMAENDYKPSRHVFVHNRFQDFLKLFYVDNPLSELGLITTKDGVAQHVFPLSRNIVQQQTYAWGDCSGVASMQIALNLALSILKETHTACSREIIVITGSISTRDPGNIYSTLDELRQNAVRTSVVSFAPELHVLKLATRLTGGNYHTVMNERIFEDVLRTFVVPPTFDVASRSPTSIQLLIGFPKEVAGPTICECHRRIEKGHYECPMCGFCYCNLPVQCKVCAATLLFSHHFARSYHFLFPLKPYVIQELEGEVGNCFACGLSLDVKKDHKEDEKITVFCCEKCKQVFCPVCNEFIHNKLYNCPGCENQAG